MKRFIMVAGLAALAGCLSETKFNEQSAEKICACFADAFGVTEDECITAADEASGEIDDACVFDAGAAKDCLDALDALTCPAELTDFPTECDTDAIYTECPVDTDTGS